MNFILLVIIYTRLNFTSYMIESGQKHFIGINQTFAVELLSANLKEEIILTI